jgi:hypothetical protein
LIVTEPDELDDIDFCGAVEPIVNEPCIYVAETPILDEPSIYLAQEPSLDKPLIYVEIKPTLNEPFIYMAQKPLRLEPLIYVPTERQMTISAIVAIPGSIIAVAGGGGTILSGPIIPTIIGAGLMIRRP